MSHQYVLPVIVFLIFVCIVLFIAVSQIPEENKEGFSVIIDSEQGKMRQFEISSDSNPPSQDVIRRNTNRYDENYYEYADRVQDARDRSQLGR